MNWRAPGFTVSIERLNTSSPAGDFQRSPIRQSLGHREPARARWRQQQRGEDRLEFTRQHGRGSTACTQLHQSEVAERLLQALGVLAECDLEDEDLSAAYMELAASARRNRGQV